MARIALFLATLFILALFHSQATAVSCKSDPQQKCLNSGRCIDDKKCLCPELWNGERCEIAWKDSYNHFTPLLISSAAITAFLHLIIVIMGSMQLWMRRGNKWKLANSILTGAILGGICRVFYLTVDPYGFIGWIPRIASSLIFNASIVIWLFSAFLMFIHWIRVVRLTKEMREFDQRLAVILRRIALSLLLLIIVVLLPVGIWSQVNLNDIAYALYGVIILVCLISFMILSTLFGYQIVKSLSINNHTGSTFRRELLRFMIIANIFFFFTAIAMIIFTVLSHSNPWSWLSLHTILRVCEAGLVISLISLLSHKKHQMNGRTGLDSNSQISTGHISNAPSMERV